MRQSDELNRSIHLRALALGFGAGFLVETIGDEAIDAGLLAAVEPGAVTVAMGLTDGVAVVVDPASLPVINTLRSRRGQLGWSQAELAGRVGVSRQSINALETGRSDPSLPLAFALSHVFRGPIEELFSTAELLQRIAAPRRRTPVTPDAPRTRASARGRRPPAR